MDIWIVECDGIIRVFDTMGECGEFLRARIAIGGGRGYFWNLCGPSK